MAQQYGFAAVVALGIGVFGLFFIAGTQMDWTPNAEDDPDEIILFEENIGQVGEARQDYRLQPLGDISVGKTRGNIPAYVQDRIEISDRFLGGNKVAVEYNATTPREGNISFTVLGRDGDGRVTASVNNQRIFEEYMVASEQEIEINEELLRPGMNTIEIAAKRDGIIGLLNSVSYSLEDVRVTVNDRKFHDHHNNFQVHDYELEDFVSGELTFNVPAGTSVRNEPLKVEVNGREVFSEKVTRGEYEVDINPQNADLHRGFNTIRFSTGQDSEYHLENPEVVINYVGAGTIETIERNFELTQQQLSFVEDEETTEYIEFEYSTPMPSRPDMTIEVNGHTIEHQPRAGRNQIDISEMLEGNNNIKIQSDGSYTLRDLTIRSERNE